MRGLLFSLIVALGAVAARAQGSPAVSTSTAPAHAPVVSAPAPAPVEPDSNVSVEQIVFAVNVSSKVPVGASDAFDESVGKVYCWNQLAINKPPARVSHVWYRDNRKVWELTILSRYHRMRIWSEHRVRAGQWRVEIQDADTHRPIAVGAFVVHRSAAAPNPTSPPVQN